MSTNDTPPVGIDHPTSVPSNNEPQPKDELRFVVVGDNLNERVDQNVEIAVAEAIDGVLSENYHLDIDRIDIEHGQEEL